ncbi:hypothetical protein I215_05452 [Galbibacter marinus]|uniref:DUF4294 domain-containing protein n=1 Tax=Galbibacter marinus TaxID=555500 RepID=K2PVX9_9FLAO|nr:DUF4294 domain-containing protein [Galbibacter marinus]EKF55654.1 hypothetical protein I215_05452 [Galbibacter marinus]
MNRGILTAILVVSSHMLWAQTKQKDTVEVATDTVLDSSDMYYYFFDGDSIPKKTIELAPVVLSQPLRFASYKDRVLYSILRRKTKKVYPYSKLASERLTELNKRLATIERKSDKRRYTRIIQRYIEEEFTAELKKLTRTEGQILVKLIHRQTGVTTFDLVKELKSGWRAFWYNTTASMFDISLKEEYHPESVLEDYLIEDILQRGFANGSLERQPSALDFDYAALTNKWGRISFPDK